MVMLKFNISHIKIPTSNGYKNSFFNEVLIYVFTYLPCQSVRLKGVILKNMETRELRFQI